MDTKQKKLNAYLLFFMLLAAVTVTMRAIASFTSLGIYGYYEGELCASANVTVLIGCIILCSYALVHRKDEPKVASFGGPLTYAPGAPLALCLVFLGVSFFNREAKGQIASLLIPLLGLLAIASALYFLFAVLYEIKLCDLRAVFGMVLALFLIFYAGFLYFDSTLPINATTKLTDQAAFVFASVFFLYETRISIGLERWPTYTALGFIASLLCAYAAIPALLVYFFQGKIIGNSIEEAFILFFLFIYILCRTILSLLLESEKPTPFMAALHEEAKKLSDAVTANGPLPFEPSYAKEAEATEIEATPEEQGTTTDATIDTESNESANEESDAGEDAEGRTE